MKARTAAEKVHALLAPAEAKLAKLKDAEANAAQRLDEVKARREQQEATVAGLYESVEALGGVAKAAS
jgi:hypothetical protein